MPVREGDVEGCRTFLEARFFSLADAWGHFGLAEFRSDPVPVELCVAALDTPVFLSNLFNRQSKYRVHISTMEENRNFCLGVPL